MIRRLLPALCLLCAAAFAQPSLEEPVAAWDFEKVADKTVRTSPATGAI